MCFESALKFEVSKRFLNIRGQRSTTPPASAGARRKKTEKIDLEVSNSNSGVTEFSGAYEILVARVACGLSAESLREKSKE